MNIEDGTIIRISDTPHSLSCKKDTFWGSFSVAMAWSAKKGKEPIEVNYSRQITNWLMKYFILSQLVSIDISRKSVNKISVIHW